MKKLKKILSIIIVVVLLPVLFINSVILINAFINPNEIPSCFGWKPFIVLSGSMETDIKPGDLVVVKECDINTIKENDIIAFKTDDIVITHRIIKIIQENGITKYVTKGDNNNTEDSGYVLPEQVEGVYKFRLEGMGNLALFIQTPGGMLVSISIPLILLILIQKIESRRDRREIERLKRRNSELTRK